ncbi:MAG: peptidoglycan-binding protein, partial [Phormidesmis sp. CAN_BIN44]|nr:peptidoglycan-binding protein [Phormidesmis sp. CAN_BIN44]
MDRKGLGWVPDYPDIKDYSLESDQIQALNGERDHTAEQVALLTEALSKIKRHLSCDPLLQEVNDLETRSRAIQKDSNQKISFRTASFASGVLAYGCKGKAVQDLQEKLKTLGYLPREHECNSSYDSKTQAAIEKFQTHQKLELPELRVSGLKVRGRKVTGIASAVTLANLAALTPISTKAQNLYLSFGDQGPGVIFLQQQLLTLKQGVLQINEIHPDELRVGEFGETTRKAVKMFQADQKIASDGIVGHDTREKLKEQPESPLLLRYLTAPIAQTHFEQLVDLSLEMFWESEFLADYKEKEKEIETLRDELFPELYPLVEVMAQLIPFLKGYQPEKVIQSIEFVDRSKDSTDAVEPDHTELCKALSLSYDLFKDYLPKSTDAPNSCARLKAIAHRIKRQRGYFASRVLDETYDYCLGDSGPAVIYLQERLRNLGFYLAPTTGYFEQLTETAVRAFQKHFELKETGKFDEATPKKLSELDSETFNSLDPSIPETFFDITCDLLLSYKLQDKFGQGEKVQPPQSLVNLLAQIIMPAAEQIDLKATIRESFETLRAIAQYSLINQAAQQTSDKRWWKTFQTHAESEQSQRILEVRRDRALLDRFEAAIVDFVRSLPKNSDFVGIIYANLREDIEDLQDTLNDQQQSIKDSIIKNIEEISKDPTSLKVIEPVQPRDPTFVRIDHDPKGKLHLSVNGSFDRKLGEGKAQGSVYLALPEAVDLSFWCSPIEDQGSLNACTAHAGVALVEYFQRRSHKQYINASRRFLYKAARKLMQRGGDSGASPRETMKAMVLFGIPPEEYCPYDEADFDAEPSAFCYAYAQNYQAIRYFRLDDSPLKPDELLAQIKLALVAGFPCMFGFTVYDSIYHPSNLRGHIPYPTQEDKREGGHSVVAVGYDDYKQVKDAPLPGAILIRNSWGTGWGDRGYGWLPYDYVLKGLARDWWSLIKAEWVETGSFGLGSSFDWSAIGG